jgi:hypothetical protein
MGSRSSNVESLTTEEGLSYALCAEEFNSESLSPIPYPPIMAVRSTTAGLLLRIVLIRRSGDSERTSASTNGLRPRSRCIAGPKYLQKSEDRSNVRRDLVERPESKSEVQKAEGGGHRVRGSECRRVREDLDKRRTRVSSLH